MILVSSIYSEKVTKFREISNVDLSYVVPVKSTVEISQKFVAFSEYMNFRNRISRDYSSTLSGPLFSSIYEGTTEMLQWFLIYVLTKLRYFLIVIFNFRAIQRCTHLDFHRVKMWVIQGIWQVTIFRVVKSWVFESSKISRFCQS